MPRSCGPCTGCCTTAHVNTPTLKKAKFEPCRHLCGSGCGIYHDSSRPLACESYACSWLREEWGGEGERPDISGVVVEIERGRKRRVSLMASPGFGIDSPGVLTAEAEFVATGYEVQVWSKDRVRIHKDGESWDLRVRAHQADQEVLELPPGVRMPRLG